MTLIISRRVFLKRSLVASLGVYTLPTLLKAESQEPLLRFGLVTDSHYADREPGGVRFFRQSLLKMQESIQLFNQEKVDFVIHLGDFKDQDKNKKPEDTLRFLKELEAVYAQFKGPRYHCIGNHDVDSITKTQFLENTKNTGIPNTQSYYAFRHKDFQFIVLDANYHKDGRDHYYLEGANWQETHIPKDQLDWLSNTLESSDKPCIVFCHHPLYEYTHKGNIYHVGNYQQVQKILQASGKVQAVFQGHTHADNHQELAGIHYTTMLAMVDYEGLDNNAYAIVELYPRERIEIVGYRRIQDQAWK